MAAELIDEALEIGSAMPLARYPDLLEAEYGLYFRVARAFAHIIGQPELMQQLTRVGMQSQSLMEWVLRIMANLLRPDELGPAEAAYKAVADHRQGRPRARARLMTASRAPRTGRRRASSPPVSSPAVDAVRRHLEAAYERHRSRRRRRGGRLHPCPRRRPRPTLSARASSASPARRVAVGDAAVPFSIQSVSKPFVFALVCEAIGPDGRRAARHERHRAAVRLGHGRRAERQPDDEPDGERRRHRHDEPGAGVDGRGEVGHVSRACPASPGGRWRWTRSVRVGGRHEPAQPRHRPPARELRPDHLRPRRGHRGVHPAVLAAGHRRGPRRDGRHARRRRGEPAHRGTGDRAATLPAGARGDGHRRALRGVGRVALRGRACPARAG